MRLHKLFYTSAAVLALVVQPLYAVVASQVANATFGGAVTVTAADMQGWAKYGGAPSSFVVTPAPLGVGALQLSANTNAEYSMHWRDTDSASLLASDLDVYYSSKRLAGAAHAAPAYVLLIEPDGDKTTQESFYAIYEPYYDHGSTPNYDDWNQWSITPASKFWYAAAYGARPAGAVNYTPLSNVLATMPNATVTATVINFGTGNSGWSALVDNVKTADGTVYDFDIDVVATNVTTNTPYESLQEAIDAASTGDEIRLERNITLVDDVDITKPLTINGNGKTITAGFVKTDGSNNSALSVLANDVTIKNVVLDGVNSVTNQLHGINAYQVTNLLVDGVTAKNFRTGILYNGSTGTIQNVHTINNEWHGINIDKPGANVNVLGNNTHTEDFNIYVDNDTIGITVYAPAYEWSRSGLPGRDNDRVYRLKVVTPPVDPVQPTQPTAPVAPSDTSLAAWPPIASTSDTADDVVVVADSAQTTTKTDTKDTDVLGTNEKAGETSSAQDDRDEWSLVNVLLAGAVAIMSLITLAGVRGSEGRARTLRILTLVPAVAAVVAVLVIEDFSAPLGWFNSWTILFVVIAAAQAVLMANSKSIDTDN